MSNIERMKERLQMYYEAEKAILTGQEYSSGGLKLKRADLTAVQAMVKKLEIEIAEEETAASTGQRRAAVGVVLRDL